MKFFRTWLITKLCLLMVMPIQAWPQALPVAQPDRVGRAISGTLQEGMRARGFAANDPRFGNTIARTTPQLAAVAGGTAAAITVGAVTAPAWVTVGLAMLVGAVITYAVNLALDGVVNWLFRPDGKIDQSGKPGVLDSSDGIKKGELAWTANAYVRPGEGLTVIYGGDGFALARQAKALADANYFHQPSEPADCTFTPGDVTEYVYCGSGGSASRFKGGGANSFAPGSCPKGQYWVAGSCSAYGFAVPAGVPTVIGQTAQQAINALPSGELDRQLDPKIISALADRAWQSAASQPGYDGVPYPQSNPLTEADARPWINSNLGRSPTVRDFVSPNPVTPTNPTPWAIPSNPAAPVVAPTAPNANTTNPASQNPQQNLGPDPGIGAPTLEAIPTAKDIVRPILDLTPELRNFRASGQAGKCPRPSFELLGRTHVLEAHCTLIDQNKQVMQAAMVLAWAVIALLIILAA